MHAKLYRSRSQLMLGGVCAGLAHYLEIDTTIVRLFFVLLALANGTGILLYLLLWLVVPYEPRPEAPAGANPANPARPSWQ